ncbi:class I SAM-dependent methyltransferase [Dyella solisilvae]|nr:methyltransferase domain-containing protein [Dyella solisilvae]
MSSHSQAFAAEHYQPRAQDYLSSEVHRQGADLDQIEAELVARRDARVLDLGCGGGHVSYRAAPLVREVVACDVTASMLDIVRGAAVERGLHNVVTAQAPAECLPFDDATFDVVVARYTTHHWRDRDAGLREARRVLKPGGLAIFIDVVAPEQALLDSWLQTLELLRDISHVRNYRVSEWVAALAAAGFSIDSLAPRLLPMRFADWVARTHTPEAQVAAIRALQIAAPAEVKEHFAMAEDGSFTLGTVTLIAH